jgi:hypothetical protein
VWRRLLSWCGVALIIVALVVLPATSVVPMYLGGSARDGYVEDGRYFVAVRGSGRFVEVSEKAWRLERWLDRAVPFSILVPGLTGLFLKLGSTRPDPAPPPIPSTKPPIMWSYFVGVGIYLAGLGLGWIMVRAPWAMVLGGWLGFYADVWFVMWVQKRRKQREQLPTGSSQSPQP